MKQRKRGIVPTRGNWRRLKCPLCDTVMHERKGKYEYECPKCGIISPIKKQYSKYPNMKHDEHGASVHAKYYRINPHVKYLKPTKRLTKAKSGREYVYYIIQATVPKEWKHGVKVTIEPLPKKSSVKEHRQKERDMNEYGPRVKGEVEEHFKRLEKEADRDEVKHREWEKTT